MAKTITIASVIDVVGALATDSLADKSILQTLRKHLVLQAMVQRI